jgi:ribosomal protein S18 acetylase RimI-like enzyme
MIKIRSMKESDIAVISKYISDLGWGSKTETLKKYLNEQSTGERDVFIAEYNGELAAYVTVQWKSTYKPFLENNIPEIKDLFAFYDYRNKGIATKLMDKAESRIKEKGYQTVGLGVGLYSDYGTAQRMYVKRGYNFDGLGINYDGEILKPGTNVRVDDSLGLCMTKELYNTVK